MKRLMFVLVLGSVLLPLLLLATAQADPPGFSVADVRGRYAFRFQGVLPNDLQVTLVGVFTADGSGNIPDIRVFRSVGVTEAKELVTHPVQQSFYTVDNFGFGEMQWFVCDALNFPASCVVLSFPTFRFVVRDRGRTLEVMGADALNVESVVSGTATLQ